MPKANKERNDLILKLYKEMYGTRYIQEKLVEAGHSLVSIARIWAVIRQSPDYVPRNKVLRFCHFCVTNKESESLYYVKKFGENKNAYRICGDCIERLVPKQPINLEHEEGNPAQ